MRPPAAPNAAPPAAPRPAVPSVACRPVAPPGFARLAVLAAAAATGCAHAPPPPPVTPVSAVADTLHGAVFEDPYRWLEDQDAPEVRAWIERQNEYAEAVVPDGPLREAFRERIRELMDVPAVGRPRAAGEHELFTLRRVGEPTAAIYRRARPPRGTEAPVRPEETYEVVVDPLAIRPDGTTSVSIVDVSSDGRYLIYAVRDGGKDEREFRMKDLRTLEDLPDRLPESLYGGVSFDDDDRSIVYTVRSRYAGPRVRRHVLGTPLSADEEWFGEGIGPTAFLGVQDIDDGGLRLYRVQHGWASSELWIEDPGSGTGPVPLIRGEDATFDASWRDGRLWIRTDHRAPNGQLLAVDLDRPERDAWEVILPETDQPLAGYSVIGDRIYAQYLDDVSTRIRVFEMDGTPAGEIEVPAHHTASIRGAGEGKAILTVEGFLTPETGYEIDLATGERTLHEAPEERFDASAYEVKQVWRTSRDGTRAPLYVVHRRGIELDGSHPTMLNGYGGFHVARRPGFSASGAAWLEQGGVLALATLRGGSEYGEGWHRAGMLENKQNVFDDFISAAEWLVDAGYTRPEHLAINGTSNGGLLVTAALTQRPDLFGAVYAGLPDIDMLRFWTFTDTNNMPALLEYGDASDPEQFAFIREYSPYDAVRDGVAYPAVMFYTGDLDTRVPPLQARKMAARLQAATSSGKPVILFYDERVGHAGGATVQTRIEHAARQLTFLMSQVR